MESGSPVEDVLRRVVAALDRAGVPYMVTGSFASSFHGAPRTTQDIDIVIAPSLVSLRSLASQFPDDSYYLSIDAALDAYADEGMFNLIDLATGWKVDFIIRKRRPHSVDEFERRRRAELLGTEVSVASPEDSIVSKLEWAKRGGSDRQIDDVKRIVNARRAELDLKYIERCVSDLALAEQWERAKPR